MVAGISATASGCVGYVVQVRKRPELERKIPMAISKEHLENKLSRDIKAINLEIANIVIKNSYDIKLTWSEQLAFLHYFDSFRQRWKKEKSEDGPTFSPYQEVLIAFMKDYFDLDQDELGRTTIMPTQVPFGADLLKKEDFKQYCRSHVDLW